MSNSTRGYQPAPSPANNGEDKSGNKTVRWTIVSLLVSSAIGIGA